MNKVIINNKEYEILEDINNAFDKEEVSSKLTDFFDEYDYIIGDWAYGKLRLKGFCNKENKIYSKINDIQNKEDYIKEHCAFGCKYFVMKKSV